MEQFCWKYVKLYGEQNSSFISITILLCISLYFIEGVCSAHTDTFLVHELLGFLLQENVLPFVRQYFSDNQPVCTENEDWGTYTPTLCAVRNSVNQANEDSLMERFAMPALGRQLLLTSLQDLEWCCMSICFPG